MQQALMPAERETQHFFRRHRPCIEIPLCFVAAGAHDRFVASAAGHAADEAPIHFQAVDAEALEIAKRGIACTEVVHRDAYTARGQLLQHLLGGGRIDHQHALGDFQTQPSSI